MSRRRPLLALFALLTLFATQTEAQQPVPPRTRADSILAALAPWVGTLAPRVDTVRVIRVDTVRLAPIVAAPTLPPIAPPIDSAALAVGWALPELPRDTVDVTPVAPLRTIALGVGANLQKALDTARAGDRIELPPGANYTGNFTLRLRPGVDSAHGITLATAGASTPFGMRVAAADSAQLARIVAPNGMPAITLGPGASYWRVESVLVTAAPSVRTSNQLVAVGVGAAPQTTLASVPHHVVLDRVIVTGTPTLDLRRCVGLHGAYAAVVNSRLVECHAKGADAQAILGYNGPGPYRIENNTLEGSGENIMFGGGKPGITGLIPADVVIRRNHIVKPLGWRAGGWLAKNLLELKAGRRVLIEGNVLENSWVGGQKGMAFNIKSSSLSPDSTQWETAHVTVRHNVIRGVAGAVQVSPHPEGPAIGAHDILFEGNLFESVGAANGTTGRTLIALGAGVRRLAFVRNTMTHNVTGGSALTLDGADAGGSLALVGNVLTAGSASLGVKGSGVAAGAASLARFYPASLVTGNAWLGIPLGTGYPSGNLYLPLGGLVPAGVGADRAAVDSATRGAVVP